jgi:hypothetical protein
MFAVFVSDPVARQVSLHCSIPMSSTFPTKMRTVSITILLSIVIYVTLGWRASRPVLRLCWLTICTSTMGMGLPIGVRCFGRRHWDKCILPITGMLGATTTWESKCQTRHQEASTSKLLIGAVPQRALPLHQDLSRRGAYATPQ